MPNVLPDWMSELPMQQQSVMLLALRGPDGVEKMHYTKMLLVFYRACVIKAAKYGRMLRAFDKGDNFMDASCFRVGAEHMVWNGGPSFQDALDRYLHAYEAVPMHAHMHFLHGIQVLGYKHPDPHIREMWNHAYTKMCESMFLNVETEEQMDKRLNDWGQEHWNVEF